MAQLDRAPVAQFKMPRLRLTWKSASVPEANWYVGLIGFYHKETPRRWWVVISTRGVLGWTAATAFTAFMTGTAALAYIWSRNPYNHVTYADLVLPTRWSELRHKRGLGMVDEGIHELRVGKYPTALMLLTHGNALAPEEERGRFNLATLYVQIGYVHRGLQLLEDGLAYGNPPKVYRELMFAAANYLEDYETVLVLSDKVEKTLAPDDTSTLRWLLTQKVTALERLKRYDEIDALRFKYQASPFFALETAWARTQAERGGAKQALAQIKADPTRFGLNDDRFRLQVALNQALGDYAGALTAIKEWQQAEPASALPRLEEVFVQIAAGQPQRAQQALEHYLIYFANQPTAVLLAFKRLGELPDPKWIRFARQETASAGRSRLDLNILYIQGLLRTGQLDEARVEFNKTKDAIAAAKVADGGWTEGTHFLLQLLQGDSPSNRAQLIEYCTTRRLGPDAFRFMLKSIRVAGLNQVADEVAIIATNRFPAFKDDVPKSDQTARESELALRVPETQELKSVVAAKFELKKLREDIDAARWNEARARLRRIEQADFKELAPELRLSRIEILGSTREQSELTSALQLYFMSRDVNQTALRSFATKWDSTPNLRESALTLCRLTADRFPQAKWAHDFRKKIEGDLSVAPMKKEELKP